MPASDENMMGRWGATSYIVGNIIGSGIFITPTSILNNVSSVGASLLVWVVAGVIATLGALCYVELGTSIRKSGGDFAYLCHMRWTAIAFSFMTCACIFTNPGTMAIQMETFSEYVIQGLQIEFCSKSTRFIANKLISFSLIRKFIRYNQIGMTLVLLLFLNFFSVRAVVARFQMVAMVAKVVAAAIICIAGFLVWATRGVQSDNFKDPFAHSTLYPGKVALALFAGLFSYDGWDILNYGAEDVKRPHRSMPFAIIVGMSTVALLYICMNLSYFVVLSVPEVQKSDAVAMTFAGKTLGSTFQYAMPFLVCIVLIGSLNATLFSGSRYIWASARERHFPSFISCINRRHDSPRAALIVLLSMAFSFLGNLEELISYVAFTHWIIRSFTMLALLSMRLGIARREIHHQAIQVPVLLPIVFLLVCLSLVFVTIVQSFWASVVGLLILAIGLAIYAIFIWDKALQRFGVYRRISHAINHWSCVLTQVSLNGNIELINAEEEKANFLSADEKMEKPSEEHEMARRRNGSSASTARVRPME